MVAKERWNELIDEAESLAKQKRDDIGSDDKEEAKKVMHSSKEEIERERLFMLKNMKSRVVDVALKLNNKLFDDEKVSRDYLEQSIDSI